LRINLRGILGDLGISSSGYIDIKDHAFKILREKDATTYDDEYLYYNLRP